MPEPGAAQAAPTHRAIVVPALEAGRLAGPCRARLDGAAARAVPSHVTVLCPFVSPEAITEQVVARPGSRRAGC